MAGSPLTPAQQETLDALRPPPEDRPSYRSTLRMDLRHRIEGELATVADHLDDPLWVNKRSLAAVHGCEARLRAEEERPFEYSVATARGQVFHKAVELSVHLADRRQPLELVDEAIASLQARDSRLAEFLQGLTEVETAELRGEVGARITGFLETFPRLRLAWRPTTEATRRVEMCADAITLHGRFDLTLGSPTDTTAGRVIVELKTGSTTGGHRDDLRFYALLETLFTGVPPLLLATFYVDAGHVETERVDEDLLESAVRRTTSGVTRLADLREPDTAPRVVPGPPCRWCPLRGTCEPGRLWLEEDSFGP